MNLLIIFTCAVLILAVWQLMRLALFVRFERNDLNRYLDTRERVFVRSAILLSAFGAAALCYSLAVYGESLPTLGPLSIFSVGVLLLSWFPRWFHVRRGIWK